MQEEERHRILDLKVGIILKVTQIIAIVAAGVVWIWDKIP